MSEDTKDSAAAETSTFAAVASPAERTFTTTGGLVIAVRRGKGRDMMAAARIAKDPSEVTMALAAQLVTVNGAAITLEELLDSDLADFLEITEGALKGLPLDPLTAKP